MVNIILPKNPRMHIAVATLRRGQSNLSVIEQEKASISDTPEVNPATTNIKKKKTPKNALKLGNKDEHGRLVSANAEVIDIKVSSVNLDRALFVMNALFLSLEKRGFSISVDKDKKKTLVKILDE